MVKFHSDKQFIKAGIYNTFIVWFINAFSLHREWYFII